MVAADFIVGIIGNIISITSFAAPTGAFVEIVKKKSAANYGGSPYIASLLSCCLWTFYGILDPDDGILVVTVNAVGIVFQVIYLALLLVYFPKEKKVKYIGFVILDFIFVSVMITVTMVAFHEGARRTFMGVLCATFTIVMYAAPLTIVRRVIQTKSVEYMPFFLVFTLFVNALVWFTFALLLKDYYVLVPNAVGIVLGAIQVLVYIIYKNSQRKETNNVEEGEIDKSKEDMMKIDSFEKVEKYVEEAIKVKKINNNNSLRNPSLTRQYSFKQFMVRNSSLKRNESTRHKNNDVENESNNELTRAENCDIENGNPTRD